MSLFDLTGKVAVITGSSRGIGRAIAEAMADQGAKVVVSSRKAEACQEVADAINAARIAGAGRIIAADPDPEKRELARKLGATDVLDPMEEGAGARIVEMTKGGVDHAVEAVGRPASAALAVKALRRGGTATILGMMPLDQKVGLGAMDLLSGKKLQGAFMGANRFPVDIPRLVDFYLRGLLDLDSIVAETIPLERVNEGFERMKRGDAARSVVVFD